MQKLTVAIFLFFYITSSGQNEWNFSNCVEYAFSNNLNLQKQLNQERKIAYDVSESIWNVSPSISAGSGLNVNLRRSTNQDNQISSGRTYSGSVYLRGSLNLFNGLTTMNNIKAQKIVKLSASEQTESLKNNLFLDILEGYAIVAYQGEAQKVAQRKVAESEKQLEHITALVEVGKREPVAIDEINATLSGAQLELVRAKNAHAIALLKLNHLIEYDGEQKITYSTKDFLIRIPQDEKHSLAETLTLAYNSFPRLMEQELMAEYLEKVLAIQYGAFSPRLNMNGGYGSGYYSTDTLSDGNITPIPDQIGNYLNPSVGLSLSIPIFNKRKNEFNIKRTKIDIENQLFTIKQEKNQIEQEINQTLQMLESSRLAYENAAHHLKFVEKSYESNKEKYTLGLINSTDFITAQNQLASASLGVVEAKLNWIVQDKLIQLYSGIRAF